MRTYAPSLRASSSSISRRASPSAAAAADAAVADADEDDATWSPPRATAVANPRSVVAAAGGRDTDGRRVDARLLLLLALADADAAASARWDKEEAAAGARAQQEDGTRPAMAALCPCLIWWDGVWRWVDGLGDVIASSATVGSCGRRHDSIHRILVEARPPVQRPRRSNLAPFTHPFDPLRSN